MRSITEARVDRTLCLVLNRDATTAPTHFARRLDGLFRELRRDEPGRDPDEIMELIWAMWIDHPDPSASTRLIGAVEAIQHGARDIARAMLDYLERRDEESLLDIARTLELEPRHLGAIMGFGQICLRHQRMTEAKAAFQVALDLNPHLAGLSDLVTDLASRRMPTH
jgi:hypothetical protein